MIAVITVPLADVRAEPTTQSSLEHQVLFGESVDINEENSVYLSITTCNEQYPGWIRKEQCLFTDKVYKGDVVVAEKTVPLYKSRKKMISLYAGTYLKSRGKDKLYLRALLPDDTYGFVDPEAVIYGTTPRNKISIITTAKEASTWQIPYLWGGVSPNGIDCSGLMKLILRLNGITEFPRDSRQQYVSGGVALSDRASLLPGDLVFFTAPEKEPQITHVGMMLDKAHFIHASKRMHDATGGKNCIAVSTFVHDSLFDNYYAQYFIGARRFFNA